MPLRLYQSGFFITVGVQTMNNHQDNQVKFNVRARTFNEKLFLIINDKEIYCYSLAKIIQVLKLEDEQNQQIINDVAVYGNCFFAYHESDYKIFNNTTFNNYLDVICNKEVILLAQYFNEHLIINSED